MEVLDFFEPLDIQRLEGAGEQEEATWYHAIDRYDGSTPDLTDKRIAIIGIDDGDGGEASITIRKYLYQLKRVEYAEEIIDLGNFKFNYQPKAYESLGFVLSELISNNLVPVILNGKQQITFAQYLAFSYLKHYVNLVAFDSRLDFDLVENPDMTASNYLQKIFMQEPAYLFGFANVGYQSHFADTAIIDFLEKLYFDLHRLGDVRANMNDLEPVLRSSHFASWDLAAIRQSDAPGVINPTPNGFYGEEACLLSRYTGMSSNIRSIGFYNYSPEKDRDGQTAHLSAQLVWYFVDGYLNRYPESPLENKDDFLKFITSIQNNSYQIVFYKSKRTDRWWMEVPINEREFTGSVHIMPCSYNDYLAATREELPDRWMQAMRKFS
jgi:arginase family enzyme